MDTDENKQKVITMLSDDKTYEKLKNNPTPKYKRKLVSIIKKLKEEDKITAEHYKFLYPNLQQRIYQECIVLLNSTSQTTLLDR